MKNLENKISKKEQKKIWVERTRNSCPLSIKQEERESQPSIMVNRKPNSLQESG
jgi:hypothetical protein